MATDWNKAFLPVLLSTLSQISSTGRYQPPHDSTRSISRQGTNGSSQLPSMSRPQSFQPSFSPGKARRLQNADVEKKDIWSSLLDTVASGKRLPEKHLVILGRILYLLPGCCLTLLMVARWFYRDSKGVPRDSRLREFWKTAGEEQTETSCR